MSLNRFGKAFLESLKEHRPETYATLVARGELQSMAREIGERAQSQFETLLASLQKRMPLPTSHPERAAALSVLASQAEELVMAELVVMDEETEATMRDGHVDRDIPNPLKLQTISSAALMRLRLRRPPGT